MSGVTFPPDAGMTTATTIRTLVLVEGDSDAAAVRALADLIGCDLGLHHIQIWSAAGVTNFSRVLADFVCTHPSADFCGMYDVADERHVRRALANAAIPVAAHESLESFGFFACVADLEDELIRALGGRGRRACARGSGRAQLVPTLPGHASAPPCTGASPAAPIPRDTSDTENPLRTASRRSPGPCPIAAPARATGGQAA
jgi:hypothetical protein